jgi:hypothetical protein
MKNSDESTISAGDVVVYCGPNCGEFLNPRGTVISIDRTTQLAQVEWHSISIEETDLKHIKKA